MAQHYEFRVVGEGEVRARGVLAFVLPQALDLLTRYPKYKVGLSEATSKRDPSRGVLRLHCLADKTFQAYYEPNTNLPNAGTSPAWIQQVPKMSTSLGKEIRWRP